MATERIHKLNIVPEAKMDVSECIGLGEFDWRTLKKETEEYIRRMTISGRLPWWGYFRCDYIDEDSGVQLKLFVYRGMKIGLMQYWDLKGVCESADWSQDAEDDGLVRVWLESKITDLPDEEDWVIRVRVNEILKKTEKTLLDNVLAEVKNEFEHKRDKEAAEELALLQSVYFEFRGKRIVKKAKRNRKLH